jgi:hypothetical protein
LLWLLAAARGLVVEEWYLWRLGSGDVRARQEAAARLGELRSSRAVPLLFERLVREATTAPPRSRWYDKSVDPFEATTAKTYREALVAIGEPAAARLAERLRNGEARVQLWAADVLGAVAAAEIQAALIDPDRIDRYREGDEELDPFPGFVVMAIDALVAELGSGDDGVRLEVEGALAAIGPASVPAVRAVPRSPGEAKNRSAFQVLRRINHEATVAGSRRIERIERTGE